MSSTIPNGFAKSLIAGAVILLGAQQVAEAVTFGRLRVQSALGQPLSVEVDISGVTPEEARSLVVRLAPSDAYRQAGVQYGSQAAAAKLILEPRGTGSYVARIKSSQPVDEPFVDLVVDAAWATGKVSRVYTILLDPAESSTRKRPEEPPMPMIPARVTDSVPVPVAPPAPVAMPVPPAAPVFEVPRKGAEGQQETIFLRPEQSGQSVAAPTSRRQVPEQAEADLGDVAPREKQGVPGGKYRVQRGDTLSGIAGQFADGGEVTLEQMLVAMYRGNTRAFVEGDPNRLRNGVILRVPSAAQGRKLPRRTARREMVALTTNFAAYRDRLATAAQATPTSAGGKPHEAAKAGTRVNEKAAAETSADRLKLSKGSDMNAKIAEGSVAAERAIQDAQAKVSQLEDAVKDLGRLKDLKQAASGVAASAVVDDGKTAVAGSGTVVASAASAAAVVASDVSAASSDLVNAASGVLAGAASGILNGSAANQGGMVPAPVAPPPAESGFLAGLVNNPILLPAAGALVALLAGLGLYRRRRASALKNDGDGVLMFGADAADLKIDADPEPPKPVVKPVQPPAPIKPAPVKPAAPVSMAPTDGFVITSSDDDDAGKAKPVPASLRREVPAPVLVSKPAAPAPAPISAAAADSMRAATASIMSSAHDATSQPLVSPAQIGRDTELRGQMELANAYLDIGDAEGARGLLQKVIDEGSGEIREQAVKLLGDIR